MNTRTITPIIVCGGKGTRLWPLSRTAKPKQFLALEGRTSLFQSTLLRLKNSPVPYALPIIITNEEYRFLVAEQAREVEAELQTILLEPSPRNTGPAITAATFFASKNDPTACVHIMPADHSISGEAAFFDAIEVAASIADLGKLITFGMQADRPETGYGYVQIGAKIGEKSDVEAYEIAQFVEKPLVGRAQALLAQGDFFWNSGMFLFRCDAYLNECRKFAPEIHAHATQAVIDAYADLDFLRLDKSAFEQAPNISIDHAIFENTTSGAVVPSRFEWSDIGAWDAVWKASNRDSDNNLLSGPIHARQTSNSLVFTDKTFVAVDGLHNVAVIATDDAVYIGKLSEAQNVGNMVQRLSANPATKTLTENHTTDYRPWGAYTILFNAKNFLVKRLTVNPGKQLSLQKHQHRAEHWVVVRGTAHVQLGETQMTLEENQSVFVPKGQIHRLSNNKRDLPLELIEVQTGAYLGEDDIVRFEDEFGRQ